jgi:hypothetical protein
VICRLSRAGLTFALLAGSGLGTRPALAGETCTREPELARVMSRELVGWRVVTPADLSPYHRSLFEKDHHLACPGISRLNFFGDTLPAMAMSMVKGTKAKLILARQSVAGSWSISSVEDSDGVPVVWREESGVYSDVYGQKRLKVTLDGLVWCGYESWAILYAWVEGRVEKIWISD